MEDSAKESSALIPPSDVKKIIDMLVVKVHANGDKFAEMISEHMKTNKKYDFLRSIDNPYRPYYLQELAKLREGDESNQKLKDGDEPEIKSANGDQPREKQNQIRSLIFGEQEQVQDGLALGGAGLQEF